MRACPVRLFTPEVSALFDLFYLTHTFDGKAWQRTALPVAGGVLDQPALELDALEFMAGTWNARLNESRRRRAERAART